MGCSKPAAVPCPYYPIAECPQYCQYYLKEPVYFYDCSMPRLITQFTNDELLAEIKRRLGT